MELRTSLYSRDVMRGFVLKWRLSVLDIKCQLCLTWLVIMKTYGIWYTNGVFNLWMKLIKLYELSIYLVAKIPNIIDERPPH